MNVSITKAVWVCPTERHHRTGMGLLGEWRSTRRSFTSARYGESAAPSTEVASTPFLIIAEANGEPSMIDCPTMVCRHATGLPSLPRPARTWWAHMGR